MFLNKIKATIKTDKNFKELLFGSFLSVFLKITGMVLTYAAILYITNKYGAKQYGILVMLTTIASVFAIIPTFGSHDAILRVIGELWEHKKYSNIKYIFKRVLLATTFLAILFILLLYFSSGFIAENILNKAYIKPYIKIISITIVATTILTIITATLTGIKKIKESVFIQTIATQLIFLIFLIINNSLKITDNLIYIYVASYVTAITLSTIFVLKIIMYLKHDNSKNIEHKYDLAKISAIALPLLFVNSLHFLIFQSDIIMLSIFATEQDIGIYNAARRIAELTSIPLFAINSIVVVKFAALHSKNDIYNLQKITKQSTKLMFFMSLPLLLFYFSFPSFVMGLFSKEFIAGVGVLVLITGAQFINVISGSVGYIMSMTDNRHIVRNVLFIAAIINITLNYILIPIYGINGAAVASAICIVFNNIVLVIYVKKKLNFWTIYIPFFSK